MILLAKFKTRKKDGQVFPVEEQGGSASEIDGGRSSESNARTEELLNYAKDIPEYQSDKWNKEKEHVVKQFDQTFHTVNFENIKALEPEWYEYLDYKEVSDRDLKDNGYDVSKMNENEIDDAKDELRHEQEEIIWGWVFEARDDHLAEKIIDNKEKIQELGLTIIDMRNSSNADKYDSAVFLGVRSAGHDFYEQYWVPLWHIFDWV